MTDTKFSARWVEITPTLAAKWLEGNVHNRPVRDHIVIQYASSMRLGLWRRTPEPIMFDGEGTLLNGQHRLWGVVESGKTLDFYVMRGVDQSILLVLDQGSTRSAHDNMNLSSNGLEQKVTADDISVLRMMLCTGGRNRIPVEFCDPLWRFYKKNILQAKNAFGNRTSPPSTVMVRAIIARASFTQSAEKLYEFCQVVLTGVARNQKHMMAIRLRDLLIGEWRLSNARPTRDTMWGKIESSLKHFLKGAVPATLVATEIEQFKIPEPMLLKRLDGMVTEKWARIRKKKEKLGGIPLKGGVATTERIADFIRDAHAPVSRREVGEKVAPKTSKSAIQGMLASLVAQKRVERTGSGAGMKYRVLIPK